MAYTPALVALISAVLAKALATLSIADPPDMVFAKENAELAYMPAELAAAKGTAWGLLCSITEYVDHEKRARSAEYRMDSAWFGQGAAIKQRALYEAMAMVA